MFATVKPQAASNIVKGLISDVVGTRVRKKCVWGQSLYHESDGVLKAILSLGTDDQLESNLF